MKRKADSESPHGDASGDIADTIVVAASSKRVYSWLPRASSTPSKKSKSETPSPPSTGRSQSATPKSTTKKRARKAATLLAPDVSQAKADRFEYKVTQAVQSAASCSPKAFRGLNAARPGIQGKEAIKEIGASEATDEATEMDVDNTTSSEKTENADPEEGTGLKAQDASTPIKGPPKAATPASPKGVDTLAAQSTAEPHQSQSTPTPTPKQKTSRKKLMPLVKKTNERDADDDLEATHEPTTYAMAANPSVKTTPKKKTTPTKQNTDTDDVSPKKTTTVVTITEVKEPLPETAMTPSPEDVLGAIEKASGNLKVLVAPNPTTVSRPTTPTPPSKTYVPPHRFSRPSTPTPDQSQVQRPCPSERPSFKGNALLGPKSNGKPSPKPASQPTIQVWDDATILLEAHQQVTDEHWGLVAVRAKTLGGIEYTADEAKRMCLGQETAEDMLKMFQKK